MLNDRSEYSQIYRDYRTQLYLAGPLHYFGPLSKSCGCSPPHPPRIGASSNAAFHTQTTEPLGKLFWKFCFAALRSPLVSHPVTDGDAATALAHTDTPTFSNSSLPDSWAEVYKLWQRRDLTRHVLRDYITDSFGGQDGFLGSMSSPTTTPLQSSLVSLDSSSHAPGRTETPLAPLASRGAEDGNGESAPPVSPCDGPLPRSDLVPPHVFNCLSFLRGVLFKSCSTGVRHRPRCNVRYLRPSVTQFPGTQLLLTPTQYVHTSVLGGSFYETPLVLPIRGHLDPIKRLMIGRQ